MALLGEAMYLGVLPVGEPQVEDPVGSIRPGDARSFRVVLGVVGAFFEGASVGADCLRCLWVKLFHRLRPPFGRLRGRARWLARR